MKKENPAPLNDDEEILLSKLFDGECTPVEERAAHDLLVSSSFARNFFGELGSVKKQLCESHAQIRQSLGSGSEFWKKVSNRIEQEEKTAVLLGPRERSIADISPITRAAQWLRQSFVFGGLAGACVAAVLLLVLSPNTSNSPSKRSASFFQSNSPADSGGVSQVSLADNRSLDSTAKRRPNILFDQAGSAMEVDWMRGNGPVKVIQSPGERAPIIWVRRKPTIAVGAP